MNRYIDKLLMILTYIPHKIIAYLFNAVMPENLCSVCHEKYCRCKR